MVAFGGCQNGYRRSGETDDLVWVRSYRLSVSFVKQSSREYPSQHSCRRRFGTASLGLLSMSQIVLLAILKNCIAPNRVRLPPVRLSCRQREQTGSSPHQYQCEQLVDHRYELLQSSHHLRNRYRVKPRLFHTDLRAFAHTPLPCSQEHVWPGRTIRER